MTAHVHAAWRTATVLRWFVLASVPAAVVGIWNLGDQILGAMAAAGISELDGWRSSLTGGSTQPGVGRALLLGASYAMPLIVVALAVAGFWAAVFARLRERTMDPGWFMSGWLFALLLPPSVAPGIAALGMSFGVIVGAHIFGGSGRYLVSPALLGVLFIHFSFPGVVEAGLPVPGVSAVADWARVTTMEGGAWADHLLGNVPGTVGATSALACLVGAVVLAVVGVASWRMLAGAVIGLIGVSILMDAVSDAPIAGLAWHWHLVVGNLAFALAFLATDPTTAPLTRPSRWLYGAAIALLTVLIRTLDPTHPEGTLFAVLLATLALPVMDHVVVRRCQWQATR